MSKKPVMLCIMDGFGWTPDETYGNAWLPRTSRIWTRSLPITL